MQKPLVWVTAYDYPTARILHESKIDAILVGDSAAMAFSGLSTTRDITLNQLLYHTQAVIRGAGDTHVIGDMPYKTYETSKQALETAKMFIELGCQSVKLEGGEYVYSQVELLVKEGIKVVGHLGLTPQTAKEFKVQGKDEVSALKILDEAKGLGERGVSHLVLECVPLGLAKRITEEISIPTIGIGAGKYCSGQVLVFHDLVGLSDSDFHPKFLKRYGNAFGDMKKSVDEFRDEVKKDTFPDENHSYN